MSIDRTFTPVALFIGIAIFIAFVFERCATSTSSSPTQVPTGIPKL